MLLETFVDPKRFYGTIYKASNWLHIGYTRGYRRTSHGYEAIADSSKMVFIRPLHAKTQTLLCQDTTKLLKNTGGTRLMLKAEQMESLPKFFSEIPDPRRAQGRRHRLSTILAISAGAILCGMRGYRAIYNWAKDLGNKARSRFGCRYNKGQYMVPSEYVIRDVLIRVTPNDLDFALQRWNELYAVSDKTLAIDGKTMCNAIDEHGRQTQIMSVIGHKSKICYTQKKSVTSLKNPTRQPMRSK
ncbi:transposase tnpA [Candidatus Magnetobacterium bavaricum]|uniref:Transposase tnpA n=2 Tax=Candidatus Magnetobacterium bavaricum TaxID=29290 RepID=A0A0F3GWX2_9BACT|nr:transposase tnpA [Candidatus Magnetobacterium bavaricum]